MKIHILSIPSALALLTFSFSCCRADDDAPPAPYAVSLTDEIPLPDKTFELGSPASFDLPPLPAKAGLVPVFRAHIYLKNPIPGGFNAHGQIRLNGSVLSRRMESGRERLLLRSSTFHYLQSPYQVFSPNALEGDLLNTMFAPTASSADEITSDKMGATYLLNLSDLARGVDNNVLEVSGNAKASDSGMGEIANASVGWIDAALLAPPAASILTRQMPAAHIEKEGVTIGAARGGGIAVDFAGDRLCLETSDDIADKNLLQVDDQNTAGARVRASSPEPDEVVQDISWPDGLSLHRSFKIEANHHISWKETWTNTTEADAAVPFNDRLFLSDHAPDSIILGGDPDSDAFSSCPANPTIFIGDSTRKTGFGWTAEDDWMRNMMQLSRDNVGGSVFTRNLMLGAHQSISFEMSILAQGSPSYWDFINDLRQRWGVNSVTVDHAIYWGLAAPQKKGEGGWDGDSATQLTAEVADRGPLYAMLPPWLGLEPDAYRAIALDAQSGGAPISEATIKDFYQYGQRIPEMKAMEEKADTLRKQSGVKIMVEMHPSMDAAYLPLLEDYPFRDETILTQQGTPFQDGGYSKSWLRGASEHGWAVVYIAPLKNSRYTQELLQRIATAIETYKADAIYSDEFEFVSSTRGYSRYDYRQSDGYSAILDDQGNIIAKPTDLGIATIPNQLAMIHAVQSHGKRFLVNGAPATRVIQNADMWHFVEGGNGFWSGATTHLTTPLVLGNVGTPKNQQDLFKLSLGILKTGNLHVPSSTNLLVQGPDNFISKQFPMTPTKVGPGFVMGPERIVTSASMDFAWPGKAGAVTVYKYDARGNLLGKTPGAVTAQDSFKAEVPAGGLLIAERKS